MEYSLTSELLQAVIVKADQKRVAIHSFKILTMHTFEPEGGAEGGIGHCEIDPATLRKDESVFPDSPDAVPPREPAAIGVPARLGK